MKIKTKWNEKFQVKKAHKVNKIGFLIAENAATALNMSGNTLAKAKIFLGEYCEKCAFREKENPCPKFTPRTVDAGRALGCSCYTCSKMYKEE